MGAAAEGGLLHAGGENQCHSSIRQNAAHFRDDSDERRLREFPQLADGFLQLGTIIRLHLHLLCCPQAEFDPDGTTHMIGVLLRVLEGGHRPVLAFGSIAETDQIRHVQEAAEFCAAHQRAGARGHGPNADEGFVIDQFQNLFLLLIRLAFLGGKRRIRGFRKVLHEQALEGTILCQQDP